MNGICEWSSMGENHDVLNSGSSFQQLSRSIQQKLRLNRMKKKREEKKEETRLMKNMKSLLGELVAEEWWIYYQL